LNGILKEEPDDDEALVKLQRELVAGVAKVFLPMYKASNGQNGYVSIQGSPLYEDKETIIRSARKNTEIEANIMAKIPVTVDGLAAIKVLAAECVPINATECMAVRQVLDVCEVYKDATKGISKPAPLYFSLITGIYDEYMQNYVKEEKIDIAPDVLWQAGMSVARKVHALVSERAYPCGFIGGGARGLHHFTEMVGANASITINWVGTADKLLEQNLPVVSRFLAPTPYSVEDELLEKLPEHRKAYFIHGIEPHEYEDYGPVVLFRNNFVTAWNKALEYIKNRR
jgi:transaldolase